MNPDAVNYNENYNYKYTYNILFNMDMNIEININITMIGPRSLFIVCLFIFII